MQHKLKRISAVTLGAGILGAALILPIAKMVDAFADNVTLQFNFNITNTDGAPGLDLAAYDGATSTRLGLGQTGDTLEIIVDGDDQFHRLMIEDGTRQEISPERISVTCSSNESCRVRVSDVDNSDIVNALHLVLPGDAPFEYSYLNGEPYLDGLLFEDESFAISYREIFHFDGQAYVIWACGDEDREVCLHLIPGIINDNFETEYYTAAEITDISDPTRTFDKFGPFDDEDYVRGMALKSSVDDWVVRNYGEGKTVDDVDWRTVNLHYLLRGNQKFEYEQHLIEEGVCNADMTEDELHACVDQYFEDHGLEEGGGVKLQPVGEPQGNSSYVSYGDRNFRLTIFNENYKAITLGNMDDLHYVPHFYEDATYVDAIDISETTEENPAIMHSILLEDTVRIKASEIGGLEIAKIEALGAPAGAISINGENNEYEFVFHSNFYDAVVFKITDTDGIEYYLKVERSTLDNWIREESVQTTFYFDADTSYSDYELIATYVYKDGTTVEKTMTNTQMIDDGLGNIIYDYETEAGRNLKMATYAIEEERGFSDELEGVYFNAKKAGTTDLIYAGTLVGSGLGIYESMSIYRH